MLRGNFQVAAHMMLHQFFNVFGRFHRQVITHAAAYQYLLHAFNGTGFTVQLN